jgi:uncharacterized protein (TIGR03086 family)
MTEQEAFKRADACFLAVLGKVEASQWHDPTPDPGWNVAYLAGHIIEGLVWAPHVLSGATIEAAGDKFSGDLLGDDPHAAAKQACAEAEAAVAKTGDLQAIVHLSFGDFPTQVYLRQLIIDITIHTWDLARGIGADGRLDPELVATVYDWFLAEVAGWRDAGLLKPAVPVPADSDLQTRLLGLSGRQAVLAD